MSILPVYMGCISNMTIYLAGTYNEKTSWERFKTSHYTEPVYGVGFVNFKIAQSVSKTTGPLYIVLNSKLYILY